MKSYVNMLSGWLNKFHYITTIHETLNANIYSMISLPSSKNLY